MKSRWWVLVAIAFAVIVGSLLAVRAPSGEPLYRGRRLSEWLTLDPAQRPKLTLSPTAQAALEDAGTNSVSTLLGMLDARDSAFRSLLIRLSTRYLRHPLLQSAWEKRQVARFSLVYLVQQNPVDDFDLTPFVPKLLSMVKDSDPFARMDAFVVLASYIMRGGGTRSTRVAPLLLHHLIIDLAHPNPLVRAMAANLLSKCGTQAAAAVPKLLTLLKDPDPTVRQAAYIALGRIEPASRY